MWVKDIRLPGNPSGITRRELGISLVETLVALAVLATVAVIFLTGLLITTRAAAETDEQSTAESIARSQTEWVQSSNYSVTGYTSATLPAISDYLNYSVNISARSLHMPDNGIQEITVVVSHSGKQVVTLESYKTNR